QQSTQFLWPSAVSIERVIAPIFEFATSVSVGLGPIIDGRSRVTHSTCCQCYGDVAGKPGSTLQTISGAAGMLSEPRGRRHDQGRNLHHSFDQSASLQGIPHWKPRCVGSRANL